MNEEQASEEYWSTVNRLNEIIESEHRGSREEVLASLGEDLDE